MAYSGCREAEMQEFDYPQIDMQKTGELLRVLCARKGISVRDIQDSLGLASNQAVYDWFNGKTLPTLNNFLALSRILEMKMEDMLVISSDPVSQQFLMREAHCEYYCVPCPGIFSGMIMNKSA